MSRIRSIKPEFPQSETIGKLSRDARLLFVQLWTVVDDAGRTRAASRMLASLLYPYDDDARTLIDGWLDELEQRQCVRRYVVDGTHYLEIINWLKHQKIDRPSKSRLPSFDEGSPKAREPSRAFAADLGPRTLDLGPSEANASGADAPPDYRAELFKTGLDKLARMTGKTPGSCRGLVGKWLKQLDDEAIHVIAAIDDADTERIVDPVPWIEAQLRSKFKQDQRHAPNFKPSNKFAAALEQLGRSVEADQSEGGGAPPPRLLSHG